MRALLGTAVVTTAVPAVATISLKRALDHGCSARDEPLALEAFVARNLRHLATPSSACEMVNQLPASPEVLAQGMEHFADHCAICHANDGSGDTPIGQNLYPKAPDMRSGDTQSLSDGELFYIIHNGIRFTGMPAWGSGEPAEDEQSWTLVHFIRHLPEISPQELEAMRRMNPRSAHELEEEEAIRQFLSGGVSELKHDDHRHTLEPTRRSWSCSRTVACGRF